MATVLITGANRGIGLALCRAYRARGDRVLAVCRRASSELVALGVEVISSVDVTDLSGAARVREALGSASLQLLLHNAGIYITTSFGKLEAAHITEEFSVNALAPLLWTQALREHLVAGSKVVLITSRAGSMAHNVEGGGYGYRMSKAALNMAGVSLARDLAPHEIAVLMLSPGTVLTDMVRGAFERAGMKTAEIPSSDEIAPKLVARIDELDISTTGRYLGPNGQEIPW